ncbi:hypothetical protein [Paenibacillus polymyxa]|uniref:hypothetical protein n=1 Tax=Paenibacillus polymyxa TaxID=1406 RepID=UPI0023794AA8|nr:hypothetical protein [Paenibacillus polymyxa]WDM23552.1 AAA family ATPase [Paenibacillus polymyxa]
MEMPLFIVSGCSGSGKSIMAEEVGKIMRDYAVFDMDIIVNRNDYQTACNNWLRIALFLSISGHSTILFGHIPDPYNIHICNYIHFFDHIYYLHLHCDNADRTERLLARGGVWTLELIQHENRLADLLINRAQNSNPAIPVINTSKLTVSETAREIKRWVLSHS